MNGVKVVRNQTRVDVCERNAVFIEPFLEAQEAGDSSEQAAGFERLDLAGDRFEDLLRGELGELLRLA